MQVPPLYVLAESNVCPMLSFSGMRSRTCDAGLPIYPEFGFARRTRCFAAALRVEPITRICGGSLRFIRSFLSMAPARLRVLLVENVPGSFHVQAGRAVPRIKAQSCGTEAKSCPGRSPAAGRPSAPPAEGLSMLSHW